MELTFEQKLLNLIQQQVIKGIQEATLVERYPKNQLKIPEDLIRRAYESIDQERILDLVREGIEDQIAKTIVGNLLTETASDTKKFLSNPDNRERLRAEVYPTLLNVMNQSK